MRPLLEIKVRFGDLWLVVSIVYVITTTILLYYQQFQELFNFLPSWPDKWVFLPKDVAFFITIYLIGELWFVYQRTKISRKNISGFQELVEELLRLEEYPELISVLDQHWSRLLLIRENKFLFPLLRRRLQKTALNISPDSTSRKLSEQLDAVYFEDILERPKNKQVKRGKKINKFVRNLVSRFLVRISRFIPDYSKYSNATDDIFQSTLLNAKFVETLSKVRPYFALKVFQTKLLQREEFTRLYIYYLLRNNQSILYYEIKENQQLGSFNGGYEVPEKNRLLHFLFYDINNAQEAKIYKPIGDEVINYLEELSLRNDDSYNHPMGNFFEEEKWKSPIFIGIFFFDIMVTNAFHQGVNWHMWLYYYPHFIEKMVKNYKPHTTANMNSEWPTKYNYLIYEIFQTLENFIKLDEDNGSHKSKKKTEMKEIPKHSIKAMIHCLQHIFSSDNKNMTLEFKEYLASIVFRLFFEMIEEPKLRVYALELREELFKKTNSREFINNVNIHFQSFSTLDYTRENIQIFLQGK